MTNSPSELIIERNKTHGSFRMNAKVSQELKAVIKRANLEMGLALTDVQQECLDMICLKISRICSGQAGYADHWADIAGYAKLAEQGGMAIPHGGKDSSPRSNTFTGIPREPFENRSGIFSDENEL